MTLSSALLNTTQISLAIDPATQTHAWQTSRSFATPTSQWTAYLNQLCLDTLLPWLADDQAATPYPNRAALASIWEVVGGMAIAQGRHRLILIPTEALDGDEFRVPQEWLDIPEWVGDYYLSVQVDPDEGWLRVNGFTTHRQLKQRGLYDTGDRIGAVDESELIADFSLLRVAQQSVTEPTRATVPSLPPLLLAQAQTLIQRLGQTTVLEPRLAIPAQTWGALLAHGGWRQQLAERRRGLPEQRSLRQWLQSRVSDLVQGWQPIEYQLATSARGSGETISPTAWSRSLQIADESYVLQVIPVELDSNTWRFELRSQVPGGLIPAGVALRLLTEDLQAFDQNEDRATAPVDQLYIEVTLEPEEGIVWEVDPAPAEYDREVLRF